jgi:hypothetical protein
MRGRVKERGIGIGGACGYCGELQRLIAGSHDRAVDAIFEDVFPELMRVA